MQIACDRPEEYEPSQIYGKELAEFRRLQTNHVSWITQLLIFTGSLAAFVGVFYLLRMNLARLIMITIVLFIHELGHFAAMYCFGYRNLKMFFVPLFGAAVSGYRCVPVFKETIVFLLGPFPGIVIGYLCGLVYIATHIDLWRELAALFVLINAINLLPIFPLDGGRFVFTLIPHRVRWIQWIIQIMTAIGLFAGYIALDWSFAPMCSGFAIGGLAHLKRINRMARRYLRSRTVGTDSDEEDIPDDVALDLITVASIENSMTIKPKRIAQAAWALWTRVKAARPNRKQVILLAAAYLGTWASVLLAQVVFSLMIN